MNDFATILSAATRAKAAARVLARTDSGVKNRLLLAMAEAILAATDFIVAENQKDLAALAGSRQTGAFIDRLTLTAARVASMAEGLRDLARLPDPIGEIDDIVQRPSGIRVGRMRIPLGLIAIIYEARPDVTAAAAGLCLKSGNAVLLKGGTEALHSNRAIAMLLQKTLARYSLPEDVVVLIDTSDRKDLLQLLKCDDLIDVVIPRGGEGLIRFVVQHARMPVIKHYKGNCHIYVDAAADCDMAVAIVNNAKTQRPGVCNAVETVLIHQDIAARFLPLLAAVLHAKGVELRGCPQVCAILPSARAAHDSDWDEEYLDLILALKVVEHQDEAVAHIHKHCSQHTEAIVTNNHQAAMNFVNSVDSSSVIVNASTRFADGGEYGLGAEIGISTSKLHAYGPMGLYELTARKFVVFGDGQIRV